MTTEISSKRSPTATDEAVPSRRPLNAAAVRNIALLCAALLRSLAWHDRKAAADVIGPSLSHHPDSGAPDYRVDVTAGAVETVRYILPPSISDNFAYTVRELQVVADTNLMMSTDARGTADRRVRRIRQIEQWLETHGTETQRKQWKSRTLPVRVVEASMVASAHEFLNGLAAFRPINADEIRRYAGKARGEVWFDILEHEAPLDCEAYRSILAAVERKFTAPVIPSVVCRTHVGGMTGSAQVAIERTGILVTIRDGVYNLPREYAASQTEQALVTVSKRAETA